MHDIGPAIALSQPIVAGAGIEDQYIAALQRVRKRDHRLRAGVDGDKGHPRLNTLSDLRNQFLSVGALDDLERELLLQELTGGVVVVDRKLRAGSAVILRPQVKKRERRR